jgi:diketogulonate reductase-like aldo/keto reductase
MHLLRLLIAASSRLAMPTVTLNNGVIMPQLSAGTGGYDNASAAAAIRTAFDAGIFAFHSANDYGNLKGVKDGLDYAKDAGGRDALFVTAMTSPCIHASPPMRNVSDAAACYELTTRELNETLAAMGLERADLFLLHGPSNPFGFTGGCDPLVCALNRAQWRAYNDLLRAGRTRAIGVSNFCASCLQCLESDSLGAADSTPSVNQIQVHVGMGANAENLTRYCDSRGIVVQAYSPLAAGAIITACPLCVTIAQRVNKSAAQVGLRWVAQQQALLPGLAQPPALVVKASSAAYIAEDVAAIDTSWRLSDGDMEALAALTGPPGQQNGRPSWGCAE